MKYFIQIVRTSIIFGVLTVLTQVGGLVYLVYKPFGSLLKRKLSSYLVTVIAKDFLFSTFMAISSFFIVPFVAAKYGRVPLPLLATDNIPLQPASLLTCLGNRHYVRPALLAAMQDIAKEMAEQEQDFRILYLDACFPFGKFPMFPHLSHADGEKLDLNFLYRHTRTGKRLRSSPTLLGYGFTESPLPNEHNQPLVCRKQGYWQYSLIRNFTIGRRSFSFDEDGNRKLLKLIAGHPKIGKIFIEPHLKERLGLQAYSKIRFHGCQAVRHDDHIHLQL